MTDRDTLIAEDRAFRATPLYLRIQADIARLSSATRADRIAWLNALTPDEMSALNRALSEQVARDPYHKPWCPFPYHPGMIEYVR